MARKKKTTDEKEHEYLLHCVREVCKHSYGKEVLFYLLDGCGIYDNQFTGNSQTFFNEGRRSVGLELIALMEEANPRSYARLLLEYNKEEVEDE